MLSNKKTTADITAKLIGELKKPERHESSEGLSTFIN